MVADLKYFDGSLSADRADPGRRQGAVRDRVRDRRMWLVKAASRRQKWIDQAQSLNLYMAAPNGRKLDELYRLGLAHGLQDDLLPAFDSQRRTWRSRRCAAPTAG